MPDYPYDDLVQQPGDAAASSLAKYETSLVGKLLTEFKLTKYASKLAETQRQRTGERALTLDGFYELFQPPIYLTAARLGYLIENNNLAQLFTTFARRTFTKHYLELASGFPEELPLGMVFPWPGLSGGLILHNGARNTDYNGVFMCWRHEESWLVLEPFAVFLHNLHTDWKPEL